MLSAVRVSFASGPGEGLHRNSRRANLPLALIRRTTRNRLLVSFVSGASSSPDLCLLNVAKRNHIAKDIRHEVVKKKKSP
jgi:hypothetical protein